MLVYSAPRPVYNKESRSRTTFDSSVGRAVDCSCEQLISIGRWFKSGSKDNDFVFSFDKILSNILLSLTLHGQLLTRKLLFNQNFLKKFEPNLKLPSGVSNLQPVKGSSALVAGMVN